MGPSWYLALIMVGVAAVSSRVDESAYVIVAGFYLFCCGIGLGWFANDWLGPSIRSSDEAVSVTVQPAGCVLTGVYVDPQKGEQWTIRDAGMVTVESGQRKLRGWVQDSVLTVEFERRCVSGTLQGGQLVWRSRALAWNRCGD